jgi:hypothetical protein
MKSGVSLYIKCGAESLYHTIVFNVVEEYLFFSYSLIDSGFIAGL